MTIAEVVVAASDEGEFCDLVKVNRYRKRNRVK